MRRALLILVVLAGCGEDDEGGSTQQQGNATPAPQAAAPGTGSGGKQLIAQIKIEERVPCSPPPETAKRCDPKLPATVEIGTGSAAAPNDGDMRCDPKLKQFCLPGVGKDNKPYFACGACPERDAIRYPFSPDRDFVAAEDNRDPFQSYLIRAPVAAGSGDPGLQKSVTARCLKKDQFQAANYSYKDLKPVGVVAQGTLRKVLMMDPGNLGHIIKARDCVGKEKAVVSDIGDEFICFQVEANAATGEVLAPDCRRLRTPSVALSSQPSDVAPVDGSGRTTITPVIAPPPTLPQKAPERAAPAPEKAPSRPSTTPQAPPPAPSQAPTTIKP